METMETMELTPDLFEPLDSAEKNSEFIAAEPRTYLSDAWHRFRKNKLALCGLVFLVIMVILAIVVPHGFALYIRRHGLQLGEPAALPGTPHGYRQVRA